MEAVDCKMGQYFQNKKTKEVWTVVSIGCNKYFQNKKTDETIGSLDDSLFKEVNYLKIVDDKQTLI